MIHWVDHFSYNASWMDPDGIEENGGLKVVTVGYVVKEEKDVVHLCATLGENGKVGSHMGIMKKLILSRWKLKDPSVKIRTAG